MQKTFSVKGKIVSFDEYSAPWKFLFIPFNKVPDVDPGGWGSIPIEVSIISINSTRWKTSLFPLKKEGYFLPLKKEILKKENLKKGDTVTVKYQSIKR